MSDEHEPEIEKAYDKWVPPREYRAVPTWESFAAGYKAGEGVSYGWISAQSVRQLWIRNSPASLGRVVMILADGRCMHCGEQIYEERVGYPVHVNASDQELHECSEIRPYGWWLSESDRGMK